MLAGLQQHQRAHSHTEYDQESGQPHLPLFPGSGDHKRGEEALTKEDRKEEKEQLRHQQLKEFQENFRLLQEAAIEARCDEFREPPQLQSPALPQSSGLPPPQLSPRSSPNLRRPSQPPRPMFPTLDVSKLHTEHQPSPQLHRSSPPLLEPVPNEHSEAVQEMLHSRPSRPAQPLRPSLSPSGQAAASASASPDFHLPTAPSVAVLQPLAAPSNLSRSPSSPLPSFLDTPTEVTESEDYEPTHDFVFEPRMAGNKPLRPLFKPPSSPMTPLNQSSPSPHIPASLTVTPLTISGRRPSLPPPPPPKFFTPETSQTSETTPKSTIPTPTPVRPSKLNIVDPTEDDSHLVPTDIPHRKMMEVHANSSPVLAQSASFAQSQGKAGSFAKNDGTRAVQKESKGVLKGRLGILLRD